MSPLTLFQRDVNYFPFPVLSGTLEIGFAMASKFVTKLYLGMKVGAKLSLVAINIVSRLSLGVR